MTQPPIFDSADQPSALPVPSSVNGGRPKSRLFAPEPFQLTTFSNNDGYDELVLARAIPFRILCEHHVLLFSGVSHFGYLPGNASSGCPS